LRATGPDRSLAQYFTGVRVVMGGLYTPEDNYVANLLGALDALNGGIITLYDWSHNNNSPEHSDASVQGLKDAGMRGAFGYGNANAEWFSPNTLPTNYDDFRRVRKQHFASDDQLVTMAMASRGPQFATIDIAEKDFLTAWDIDASKLFDASSISQGMKPPIPIVG
jgi:5-methylthioadenosine/S-adenosylhomocysteine deaminase